MSELHTLASPQDLLNLSDTNLSHLPSTIERDSEGHDGHWAFETTSFRFVVLGLFAAFGFITQLQDVGFATTNRETESYFGVSALKVNILSLLSPMVYLIGAIPGCFLYNKVGLRYGIIIGAALTATASLIKLIAVWAPKYPLLAIAQVLVAGGQILFLSVPTLVAGVWFPPNERTVATAVASLIGFLGMAVGMIYPPYVVSVPNRNTPKEWGALAGSQCVFSMLVLFLTLMFVKDKPKHRPSFTSTDLYKVPLLNFVKLRFRDPNFLLLAVSFGLITGLLIAIEAVLAQLLQPFGIGETRTVILAFTGITGGAANCALVGLFVDHTHHYKYTAIPLSAVSTSLLLVAAIDIKLVHSTHLQMILVCILVPLIELWVLPLVPVVMELAVELTYPCPETVSSTIVLASMCLFAFIGMVVFSLIIGDTRTADSSFLVVLLTFVVCALSAITLVFVKETKLFAGGNANSLEVI